MANDLFSDWESVPVPSLHKLKRTKYIIEETE